MSKLLEGFLYGLGFSAAGLIAILFAAFVVPWDRAVADQSAAISSAAMTAAFSGGKLVLVEHEKQLRGDDLVIIGRLKNEGNEAARSYSIQIELFDAKGKLVDVFRESSYASVPPGELRSFRVSSGSCRSRPIPPHDTYKATILSDA
jgi:hypothetical protein